MPLSWRPRSTVERFGPSGVYCHPDKEVARAQYASNSAGAKSRRAAEMATHAATNRCTEEHPTRGFEVFPDGSPF